MVYLDALVPLNNESVSSIFGFTPTENDIKIGGIVPAWVDINKFPPKDVPHPIKTMTDQINLSNKEKNKICSVYILTVEKNKTPEEDDFASPAEKAKSKGQYLHNDRDKVQNQDQHQKSRQTSTKATRPYGVRGSVDAAAAGGVAGAAAQRERMQRPRGRGGGALA